MKKVILLLMVLAFNLLNAQEQSYTYDAGTYSNPVRNPTVKNNPWVDVTTLTLEDTQKELIRLVGLSKIWKRIGSSLRGSFDEANNPEFFYIGSLHKTQDKVVNLKVYDLSNIVKFNGIAQRDKNINILNIYMMVKYKNRIHDRSYNKESDNVYLRKEKMMLVLNDYNDARKFYVLLQHYQNLLNSQTI